MLTKLLKYDFKALLKFWWIAAISSVGLTIIGTLCHNILYSGRVLPAVVNLVVILGIFMVYFGYAAFSLLTAILIFIRYFKNFFTDEGYLTFTLPVKRSQLLMSKIISGCAIYGATLLLIGVEFLITINCYDDNNIFGSLVQLFAKAYKESGVYFIVDGILFLLLAIMAVVINILFIYLCITIGATIARRGKVIVGIGIYYGASSTITFILQILMIFGTGSLSSWFSGIPEQLSDITLVLVLAEVVLILGIVLMAIYLFLYYLLDKKLNLS